ncbi:hypothetical protein THS5294_01784 [Thalassobacter stenotrophicus]|uniref:Uncharacterized protein n=2 Tax=Thalassobacter stenotrophicus TaxID=266809 RepID=A0A0N7LTE7_9RHOB|nr:hypothetical protein THS5294_01784 [Thalassobacter stenotrophicus]SHI76634.1 hypothetical protein SAMN02744035_01577 [Thalassobacter stenotrophicus DSM 16310]
MHTLERLILSPRLAADVAARLRTAQTKSPPPRNVQHLRAKVCEVESGLTMVFLPPALSGEHNHSAKPQTRL